jgi:hypothetical protein
MTVKYYPEQLMGLLPLNDGGDEGGKKYNERYNETAKCQYDYYMLGVTLLGMALKEGSGEMWLTGGTGGEAFRMGGSIGGDVRLMGSTGRVSRELMSQEVGRLPVGDLKELIVDIMSRSILKP